MSALLSVPGRLTVGADGALSGASGRYTKHLGDMGGVYRDQGAYEQLVAQRGADALVYTVHEHRNVETEGALIIGTSTLLPGRVGEEFAVTRGHLHARADRAELYHCLSGSGVMLLETVDGRSEAVPLTAGEAVHVPGHWVHRSVNTGEQPFVTLFCYPADAGQDYGLIEEAGGMATLVVDDGAGGWTTRPNPDHTGYSGRA
ncbi:glucose-6-phosphate isomerase family protein [Ornithinimicrobium sediminis]|uniref:glucose-6-phosphate isomerase family protein n=1 Tax=Ornithinimicrobium sediminis TaxID=2904603 RepID=UPI001E56178D|nr:glucose-6-phosphate isomerase family protein [Ornithinimicrobium sediminis]MCE0487384.1 cupin domain-containing protein [Ornithinimicrobium sediminis]